MSFLKKLFGGGGGSSAAPAEMHNGFAIYAEPLKDGGTYRIAARIEKEIDGELKVHRLVRADTLQSLEEAMKASSAKAKMLIDQQGESIFR
jgi:hypothetical protein